MNAFGPPRRLVARIGVIAALLGLLVPLTPVSAATAPTPIVIFPAFHFTRLLVTVDGQSVDPNCPSSGSFEDWFPNPSPSTTLSQVCQDELLTLRFDRSHDRPIRERFRNQHGVDVAIADYGSTNSAPVYEPMYQMLEAAGYTRDLNIRVAGYDSRLTPDIGDFLQRTKDLIEDTYRDNGNTPVHLTGHSNGPLYAQWLLTHTSDRWKHKFIHGFSPIAGNWPGQGGVYPLFFTGLNVVDFTFEKLSTHLRKETPATVREVSARDLDGPPGLAQVVHKLIASERPSTLSPTGVEEEHTSCPDQEWEQLVRKTGGDRRAGERPRRSSRSHGGFLPANVNKDNGPKRTTLRTRGRCQPGPVTALALEASPAPGPVRRPRLPEGPTPLSPVIGSSRPL